MKLKNIWEACMAPIDKINQTIQEHSVAVGFFAGTAVFSFWLTQDAILSLGAACAAAGVGVGLTVLGRPQKSNAVADRGLPNPK